MVVTKSTDKGLCMNGIGECPERYKSSVIYAYIKRALTHCSTWSDIHDELKRATQILVNNNYSCNKVNEMINKILNKFVQSSSQIDEEDRSPIHIYYRNYMSTAYKVDERILRDIVRRGVITVSDDDRIQFTIYYKNRKVNNIIMKNSPKECDKDISRVGVIYQYFCQL